ncbi:hypothetical protein [uncultured Phocaeicola sp.]|uniref:hypothetical protein n=1 Tax=uncultured Phocaeicola sp. TaxID=990718 RepID=UPI001433E171|nr:hypothetical protein [uncultured Phocaeicola sp.]GFH99276.1 hypothetical protein IMSAGC004_01679 [Bacteroidaceae bacterium]
MNKRIRKNTLTVTALIACLLIGSPVQARKTTFPHKKNIYKKGWIDFNKNGKKDIYEDPSQDIQKRVDDLLSQMNVDEKNLSGGYFLWL